MNEYSLMWILSIILPQHVGDDDSVCVVLSLNYNQAVMGGSDWYGAIEFDIVLCSIKLIKLLFWALAKVCSLLGPVPVIPLVIPSNSSDKWLS